MSLVAPTLQSFFTDRLLRQRRVTPRTITAYRDSLRLLVTWVHATKGVQPYRLDWSDLDTGTITAFLDHLEQGRNNTPGPATSGSPPSGPCSPTPRSPTRNTPS